MELTAYIKIQKISGFITVKFESAINANSIGEIQKADPFFG